jgi:hypothetical protein
MKVPREEEGRIIAQSRFDVNEEIGSNEKFSHACIMCWSFVSRNVISLLNRDNRYGVDDQSCSPASSNKYQHLLPQHSGSLLLRPTIHSFSVKQDASWTRPIEQMGS